MEEFIKFALSKGQSDVEISKTLNIPIEEISKIRKSLNLPATPEMTMKEAARIYLKSIPLQEKFEKFKSMDIQDVWEMAEGKAATTGSLDIKNTEPIRIDITHQLLKVYGPIDGTSTPSLPPASESEQLPAGSGQ
jgi:hypothetical protein